VITVRATRYQRERWVTPDGQTILAPLPEGIDGHFGAELHRFVLTQYHQGQSILSRTLALLRSAGVSISNRQLQRLLTEKQDGFITEAEDVLRAGLETSPFVSVDDTRARHKGKNGFCTRIRNEWFTWFGMRFSKSRLNFLDLLRAGHTDYVLNDAVYDYMRDQGLPAVTIARLRVQPKTRFNGQATWLAHLDRLRPTALSVAPDPVRVASEGAPAFARASLDRQHMAAADRRAGRQTPSLDDLRRRHLWIGEEPPACSSPRRLAPSRRTHTVWRATNRSRIVPPFIEAQIPE
jgi:hypothetical protein